MSSQSQNYQNLIVGKGETVVDGKTHWQDFVQVQIEDPQRAFKLAMDILRQLEHQQMSGRQPPITFSLTGALESEKE